MTETQLETAWQRLDPRMMLVHPVREVLRFLPAVLGLFVAGAASGGRFGWLQLLSVLIPIGLGLARYLTTSYRIHADRVELKRALISTRILSTPLDRVRTVDLTASPIQRLLGLSTVRIGTGSAAKLGDDGLDLDGLPTDVARALRGQLLSSITTPATTSDGEAAAPVGGERLVAGFAPEWLRFAPFTSAGFIAFAGVVGVGFQLLDVFGFFDDLENDPGSVPFQDGSFLTVAGLFLLVAVLVAAFSVIGYLIANGNFALSHTTPDGSWHVRRGLLTTRETSLDDHRLRGVALGEPWGLRLVRGGSLSAIVTGLDPSESGSSTLLPPAPRRLVDQVAAEVVGAATPVTVQLVDHGPRARTRRWTRALIPAAVVAVVPVVAAVTTDAGWLAPLLVLPLLAGAALGFDRARSLGHTLVDGWLVARSGSLTRKRELLATDAIIGWTVRSSWFQRRAGLVTLVATTAGGRQSVTVLDVPAATALDVATAATPTLVTPFAR